MFREFSNFFRLFQYVLQIVGSFAFHSLSFTLTLITTLYHFFFPSGKGGETFMPGLHSHLQVLVETFGDM